MSNGRHHVERRRASLWIALAALVVIAGLALGEIGLRLIGFGPWRHVTTDENEPRTLLGDPELGWKNSPGVHVVPAYTPEGEATTITISPDGSRLTSQNTVRGNRIVVIGGSFTFGWAVSDDQTYAWRLQGLYPEQRFHNFGTGAYGTYQSLLLLERLLKEITDVSRVLYGFIEHHEIRNLATPSWADYLARYSRRGHLAIPYVTVDGDGALLHHAPQSASALPYRQSSALINLLDRAWRAALSWQRKRQKNRATELLLLEMRRLVEAHAAGFSVALLQFEPQARDHYVDFLRRHDVHVIDCSFPVTEEFRVPGEGHPNGAMHARWAACIADGLGEVAG